jgi:ATP-dependent exoDNAse (exonuclease V) beta subunit
MADGSAESAEDDEAIDPLLAEAARVAKTARELVDAGHRRPASVAVLFGRRKWMDVYAAAMRDAGVPFAVAGGRGFWMRQEVQDLANLLLALTQPDDAVSLVGALRGPYLLLEDAALLWLVEQRREGSRSLRVAWDALVHGELVDELAVLPAGLSSALERAAASARRWLRAREEMPLSRLLRLILVDTRATFRFAVLDPTGQMAANVEKVVALAVAEDARGALAALAFARSLREEADLATDEAEATLDASAPVILMTVHQSKGLEFPWVLLPDLRARILHQERGVCTVARLDPDDPTRWDLGLRLAVPTEEGWERRPTLVHRAATRQSALEERAEAARLFYVACTRAEDGLVLFLGPDGGVEPPELARARHAEDWVRGWQAEAGWQEQPWVQAASTAAPPPPAMPVVEPGLLAPIQVPGTVLLHPTDLVRGTLQHRRGPAQPPSAAAARLRGTIVHAAIEDGGDLDADAVARRCRAALLTRGLGDDVHHLWLTAEVRRHLDGYRRAAPVALLGSAPGARALREVAFRLALPRDWAPPQERWVLDGVADLLWRDEEARTWVVLDHKTDEADPDDLAAHYRPQLVGYAWAMARILPEVRDEGWSLRAEVLSTAAGRRVVALPRCSPRDVEGELRGLVGRWAGARGGP